MNDISFLNGTNNQLLVIAPHREESGTGKIALKVARALECPAIINHRIKRKDSDLNNFEAAVKHPDFITTLNNWAEIKRTGRPLAIWLHGHGSLNGPKCVVGYGNPASPVANPRKVETLIEKLREHGISCLRAMPFMIKFAAQTQNNMAQYFKRHGFDVDSIQLEVSKQLRGMLIVDFVEALNSALQATLQSPVEPEATSNNLPKGKFSVEEAASKVIEICSAHLYRAAVEVGRYFVETLYEGNYERARNPRMSKGLVSFHKVCARVHERGGPSIRWLYDALKLAVNEYDYGSMKAYAKLSLSKKVALFRLDDNPEAKRELIKDAAEQNLTTRQIKAKAADEHWIKFMNGLDKRKPYEPTLEEKEKILTNKIERRQRKISQLQDEIVKLQAKLDIVRSQLNDL